MFAALVVVNYVANLIQESVVARVAEVVLFDLRRAMYAHLQRVALAFMDRTEVGRLMRRGCRATSTLCRSSSNPPCLRSATWCCWSASS